MGALAILILGAKSNDRLARGLALGFAFLALADRLLSCGISFNPALGGLQFEELHAWIPALGVEYHVGIDGLGLLMLLLSAIVVPMAMARFVADSGAGFRSTSRSSCCCKQDCSAPSPR